VENRTGLGNQTATLGYRIASCTTLGSLGLLDSNQLSRIKNSDSSTTTTVFSTGNAPKNMVTHSCYMAEAFDPKSESNSRKRGENIVSNTLSNKNLTPVREGRKPGAFTNPRVIPTCIAFWPREKELNLHIKHTTLEPYYNKIFLNLGRVSHECR
jgi:hypothetical protein